MTIHYTVLPEGSERGHRPKSRRTKAATSVSEQADFDERRKGTPWRCVIMVEYGVIKYRHMTTKRHNNIM